MVNKLSVKRIRKNGIEAVPVNYYKAEKSLLLRIREKLSYWILYRSIAPYELFLKNSEFFFIKPSFVCAFGLTNNTYKAGQLAKCIGAKFILFIASDEEINFVEIRHNTKLNTSFEGVSKIISASDTIFVQNTNQKQKLSEMFNVKAQLILNPIDLTKKFEIKKEFILWVGKSSSYKNPLLFKDLCKLFPGEQFLMICNRADDASFEEVAGNMPPNCRLIEHVDAEEIESYFAACKVFINTSDFEGFPNTFLQAAKYGKPIISYKVDPNAFISDSGCGIVCNGDPSKLQEALGHLLTDEPDYGLKAENALSVVQKYSIDEVGKVLAKAFV